MKHDALKEALHRRKGSNVDITLVIGGDAKPDDASENKELAPEVKDTEAMDKAAEGGNPTFNPADGSNVNQDDIIKSMLGGEDAGSPQGPNSLKSRAHALMKEKLLKK